MSFWSTSRPTNSSSTLPVRPEQVGAQGPGVGSGPGSSKRWKSAIQPRLLTRSGATPSWTSLARSRSLTTRTLSAERTSQRPIGLSTGLMRRSRSQYGLSIMSPAIWTESGSPNRARSRAPASPQSIGSSVETRSKPRRRWSAPPIEVGVVGEGASGARGARMDQEVVGVGDRRAGPRRGSGRSSGTGRGCWRTCAGAGGRRRTRRRPGWTSEVSVPIASRRRWPGALAPDDRVTGGLLALFSAGPGAPYTGDRRMRQMFGFCRMVSSGCVDGCRQRPVGSHPSPLRPERGAGTTVLRSPRTERARG